MFERYTENARQTIFHARKVALQSASGEIGVEHLLFGLLETDERLFTLFIDTKEFRLLKAEVKEKIFGTSQGSFLTTD
ncbi:MAG: Clp protease N-terminal domain-containing protein, partial [Candidatus Korobacteraceae bacterium]